MDKSELKKFATAIKVAYPSFAIFDNPENQRIAIDIWVRMLSDVEYSVAMITLEAHIANSKFAPTISDIRDRVLKVTRKSQILTSSEAWGEVLSAIRNHGYYDAKGAFESMSPIVAGVARRFGWAEICTSEKTDVIRGQFIKLYDSQACEEIEIERLPLDTKIAIENHQKANRAVTMLAQKLG